jgi:hypothetical protein
MGARLALLALAAGAMLLSRRAAAEPSEAELKAEVVERFVRFVDWDPRDLPNDVEFEVCVIGDSAMTPHLRNIAKKRKLRGRRAVVSVLDKVEQVVDCHLVMIAGGDRKRLRSVISRTDGRPILTIAEASGAADQGAIINLFVQDNHIKFEVNALAAKDSGLKVRAKLLRAAARVVRGKD